MKEICECCGADEFKVWDYDKIVKEKGELSSRFQKALAQHGLSRAEWTINEIELTESMKFLQRKTKKQAAAIGRLEEKLKRLKQQPYREEKTAADLEPGDLLLCDTCCVTEIKFYDKDQIRITGQMA